MALGDSITHGANGDSPTLDASAGGYRAFLSARLGVIEHEWLGRWYDGPDTARRHEGWSGYTIRQINTLVVDQAINATDTPDIILLMIGTNDAWNAPIYNDPLTTRERMLENLRDLLFSIRRHVPQIRVVVSTIPPIHIPDPLIQQAVINYNAGLDELMHELQGDGMNVGMVNAGGRVPVSLLPDLIHPGQRGYEIIAGGFYEAFVLPSVPEPAMLSPLIAFFAMRRIRRDRDKFRMLSASRC